MAQRQFTPYTALTIAQNDFECWKAFARVNIMVQGTARVFLSTGESAMVCDGER